MATKLLMPGFGGQDTTTLSVVENGAEVFSDIYDMSRCSKFTLQIKTYAGDGTLNIRVQQMTDGSNWADVDAGLVGALGAVFRFPETAGPFGKIRLGALATNGSTNDTDSLVVAVTGWNLQTSS